MPRPRLFVGSASENLEVADAIHTNLDRVADVTVWDKGIFLPGKFALESLTEALAATDFGAFVFSPNDLATIRGQEKTIPRDNVIFELGLFIGRLGRERTFIVQPRGMSDTFHLPSDLLGLTTAQYNADRHDSNLRAALAPACTDLRRIITTLGPIDSPAGISAATAASTTSITNLSSTEVATLRALVTGEFTKRSLGGIASATELKKDVVNSAITVLMASGFVDQTHSNSGELRWSATASGRIYFATAANTVRV